MDAGISMDAVMTSESTFGVEILRDITSLIDTWRYIAAYKSDTWKDIATTAAARAVATKSAVLGRQIIDFYSNSQRERQ